MNTLDKSSISAAVEEVANAVNDTHPLVGVVNNAGMCIVSPMELTPESCIRDLFELDLFAYIAVVHAFLPLIKKYRGRFINIGSYGGFVNPPMWVGYSAVKAAIEGMTRSWRFELKPFGVGMTCIRPGWTRTHGIGPKITAAWDAYFDNVDEGNVAGVDSLGNLVPTAKAVGPAERHIYGRMMMKW
jgi:NAD(P)-dependent dehydrogenase (short-subunit alcohol dehydrogenase family)